MVIITVIWLSVKYQNFFSFQNMTSPLQSVNVPFISSYKGIKVVIRTEFINMTVILSMWAVFLFCFVLFFNCFFLPEAEFNSFLREIVLVMRNCCITMSEIELVFRRAEFRCSGSLYTMLLFEKLYLIQIFNQYLLDEEDDTCRPMDTYLSS